MKKAAVLIAIAIFICLNVFLLFDLSIRVKFMESFSKAQQFETKDDFMERYGRPVYELTKLSEMQVYGPIQDEVFLRDKTLCLFGYKFPYRYIVVYFDTDTYKTAYVTWKDM